MVGLQPDAVVYTALVHAYAEQGLWAEAEKTLRYFTSYKTQNPVYACYCDCLSACRLLMD